MNAIPQMKDEAMDDEPDDIRNAVRQLSFAYRRSAEALSETGGGEVDESAEALRRAEAVLFAAGEPLSAEQIAEVLPQGVDAAQVLMSLKAAYAHRGVNLVEVAGKWRFQTAEDLAYLFVEERHEQKKLSQAALETLAIIAYGQPVTRAEIEAVRGVAVSKGTIDQLLEAGWVRIKGRRKTPGRPVTYGTTDDFLEHFGLESLELLPGRAELEAGGLLSDAVPDDFDPSEVELPLRDLDGSSSREENADDAAFVTDFMDSESEDD
ncbi:MAG: SMC-Scp complex subunit ScpB [Henriciella sp.]|uniref:SMC-Scp complex subunit ScpB n=1 Tax=Henriciella sp. TaxID=1968823 RepID=UPI0032EC3C88